MPLPNKVINRVTSNEKMNATELKAFMDSNGISNKELAEIFGVTIQAVNLWLSAQRDFSVVNSRLVRLFIKYPKLLREF